jgi:hypothetical protein
MSHGPFAIVDQRKATTTPETALASVWKFRGSLGPEHIPMSHNPPCRPREFVSDLESAVVGSERREMLAMQTSVRSAHPEVLVLHDKAVNPG